MGLMAILVRVLWPRLQANISRVIVIRFRQKEAVSRVIGEAVEELES